MWSPTLRVVGGACLRDGRLLLVSNGAAPAVFYLPGGKPEQDETPEQTLRREIAEELGAHVAASRRLTIVRAPAAIEGVPMEMQVLLMTLERQPRPHRDRAAGLVRLDEPGSRLVPRRR